MTAADKNAPPATSQRIDRWLWCARFFKTRTLAAKFVNSGVRLSRDGDTQRIDKPSAQVRVGDNLVFTRHDRLFIIEVTALADRRGSAAIAKTLYIDQSPPPPPKQERATGPFERERGAGRPTKKERRALDAVRTGKG